MALLCENSSLQSRSCYVVLVQSAYYAVVPGCTRTFAQASSSLIGCCNHHHHHSYFCSFRGDVSIMIYMYVSFVVTGDEYKTFQELHVMYRIYHPILKFYQMLRVVPRHNPIREIYHHPIRNSYRMIRTIPSVIPAYPTSVQTSTCKPGSAQAFPYPINLNLHTRRRRYIQTRASGGSVR